MTLPFVLAMFGQMSLVNLPANAGGSVGAAGHAPEHDCGLAGYVCAHDCRVAQLAGGLVADLYVRHGSFVIGHTRNF